MDVSVGHLRVSLATFKLLIDISVCSSSVLRAGAAKTEERLASPMRETRIRWGFMVGMLCSERKRI